MFARDVMTKDVVTVTSETPVAEIARLLIGRRISAVPVVDGEGGVIGMVSEGDLIQMADNAALATGEALSKRRDWWLALLAEGEPMARTFLESLRAEARFARDVMSSPVVSVAPATGIAEIARILEQYDIKRVPVVEGRVMIGIVSRADVLRAFAAKEASRPATSGRFKALLAEAATRLHAGAEATQDAASSVSHDSAGGMISARDFNDLMSDHVHDDEAARLATREKLAAQRRERVQAMIDTHIDDAAWRSMLHEARQAAMRGDKQHMLLRFPCDLCSDGGRAINVGEENWAATLEGEAAEIFLRFQHDLQVGGFSLKAQTIDFPGGFPGDIGLFLRWA